MGTLVVLNNDEWDHFEAFFHIVIIWHNRVVLSAHSKRARVGLHGSSVGPKMVQNYCFQICS